jgi:hypothetical protein
MKAQQAKSKSAEAPLPPGRGHNPTVNPNGFYKNIHCFFYEPVPTPLVFSIPEDQVQYDQLFQALQKQCLPLGEVEQQVFQTYALNSFQAQRMAKLEARAQDRMAENPESTQTLGVMETCNRMAASHELRATRAFKQLSQLQKDRYFRGIVYEEMRASGLGHHDISEALPIAAIQGRRSHKTSPMYTAIMLQTFDGTPNQPAEKQNRQNEPKRE